MVKSLPRPTAAIGLALAVAAVVIGSLAMLARTNAPDRPDCRAEEAARAEAQPGFVALAGEGLAACLMPGR